MDQQDARAEARGVRARALGWAYRWLAEPEETGVRGYAYDVIGAAIIAAIVGLTGVGRGSTGNQVEDGLTAFVGIALALVGMRTWQIVRRAFRARDD